MKPRKRPETTQGVTFKVATGCGSLYVTVNRDDIGICEVFAKMGKSGGCQSAYLDAIARVISASLRAGVASEDLTSMLRGISCPSPIYDNGRQTLSCPDAIAYVLTKANEINKEIKENDNADKD